LVVGSVILIVNHLRQEDLSSNATVNLGLNEPEGGVGEPPSAPARGPFPPFPLGGSLRKDDLFDFMGVEDRWFPVKGAVDVEVDWTQFRNVDLFADVEIRGGSCRVGIWDVENDVVVTTSGVLTAPRLDWRQLRDEPGSDEVVRTQFQIPHHTGRKLYRLIAQRGNSSGPADVAWVKGSIAFRSISFGGDKNEWFAPADEDAPQRGRVPGGVEILIDWAQVRDPINTVIADITLVTSCTIQGQSGTGRAIVRDLSEDTLIITDNVGARGKSYHGYDYPGKRTFRSGLPRKSGRHRYVLEVEVAGAGMRATATGYLQFGH
jgi:hypothetical protein